MSTHFFFVINIPITGSADFQLWVSSLLIFYLSHDDKACYKNSYQKGIQTVLIWILLHYINALFRTTAKEHSGKQSKQYGGSDSSCSSFEPSG